MVRTWYNAKARGESAGEISIFSDIGMFGISSNDFHHSLRALGPVDQLFVKISSDGGDVSQGFHIYNMLMAHPAFKTVIIEGLAASMASVIAMVGDEIEMPENAMLMIHNPWGQITGEAEQIASFADALTVMRDNIADAYKQRTGLTRGEIKKMMDRETWLSAKAAKAKGFADRVVSPREIHAQVNLAKFNRVPEGFGRIIGRGSNMAAKTQEQLDAEALAAAQPKVKTEAELRVEILAGHQEVRSLCKLAGKPEMADKLIQENKSRAEVMTALDAAKTADAEAARVAAAGKGKKRGDAGSVGAGGAEEISARNNPGSETVPAEIDPVAIYNKWNGVSARA